MTNEPTVQDLLDRIDQLEERLAPPPEPPTMNELLRAEIERVSTNTFTVDASEVVAPTEPKVSSADGGKGGVLKTPPNPNAAMNAMIRREARGY